MSTYDRALETAQRLNTAFSDGTMVIVRRSHSLNNPVSGSRASSVTAAAATLGDTSITLTPDSGGLAGSIPAGTTVTISGDATAYLSAADTTAQSNAITLTITPSLAGNVSSATAVTLGSYVTISYEASYVDSRQRDNKGTTRKDFEAFLTGTSAPEVGDLVMGYSNFRVQMVEPNLVGGSPVGWLIKAGDGSLD